MDYTALALINAGSKNVPIRVRVARSWDYINPRNISQTFSSELLLIDDQGDTIQATMSNDVAETLKLLLLEGSVYHISGFSVQPTQANCRVSTHMFRLRLPNNTYIRKLSADTENIPYDTFNFLSFDDVKDRTGMVDYVIDTYGLITRLGDMQRVRALDQLKHKRSVYIEDSHGVEMEVTLWDGIALDFPEDHVVDSAKDKPVSVAFVAMIAKPYNDGFTLNSTSGTRIFINPEIPEILSFIQGINKPYPLLHKTVPLLDDSSDIEDEKDVNRKSISELLQIDIHTDKLIKFTSTATIKEIDSEEGWWYRACPRCKGSVQNLDNKLWCKNCRFIEALPVTWYRLRLIVEDTTGCATFVLFGRLAADLIGVPAHTLAATFKDKHDIPPMLSKLQGLKKTFQVQLGGFIEHPGKLNFKVIYIFKDALLTPKKEILSPLSARSTHLTSPLTKATHSPPAQRALQFNIHESPQKTKSTVCSPLKKRRKETGSTSGQP